MNQFLTLPLWGVIIIITYVDMTQGILPECTFTTTSGFCTGMAGRFIRRDHNPKIRALYIVNSDLTALTADDFAPFQSLSTLHINNCTLPLTTERSLLSELKDLNALQITHSNLSDDIKYMFVNNTALNTLSLQRNKITQIRKEAFDHLTEINILDLSNNEISRIEEDSFINLKKLKKLILIGNKIGEHFDPAFLSPLPGECGVCGGECPADTASRCELNEGSDCLWRVFEEKYDIVFLKGNPICDILDKTIGDESKNATNEEAEPEPLLSGCTIYQGEKCSDRKTFFLRVCNQDPNEVRRSGRNHDEDLESAPEMEEDLKSAPEEVLETAPEVEEEDDPPVVPNSVESTDQQGAVSAEPFPVGAVAEVPTIHSGSRPGDSGGPASDGDHLQPSFVEAQKGPQTANVVLSAGVGVGPSCLIGGVLVVFAVTGLIVIIKKYTINRQTGNVIDLESGSEIQDMNAGAPQSRPLLQHRSEGRITDVTQP